MKSFKVKWIRQGFNHCLFEQTESVFLVVLKPSDENNYSCYFFNSRDCKHIQGSLEQAKKQAIEEFKQFCKNFSTLPLIEEKPPRKNYSELKSQISILKETGEIFIKALNDLKHDRDFYFVGMQCDHLRNTLKLVDNDLVKLMDCLKREIDKE